MEPVAVGDIALGDGDEAGQAGLGSQKVVVGRIETAGALGVREAIADGEDLALAVVEEGEAHAVDESEGARGELLEASREHTGRRGRGRQPRGEGPRQDRKSTRLNSSHTVISYAVFCLKKKK